MVKKRVQIYSALFSVLAFVAILVGRVGSDLWLFDLLNHFFLYFLSSGILLGLIAALFFHRKTAILLLGFLTLGSGILALTPDKSDVKDYSNSQPLDFRVISFNLLSSNPRKHEAVQWVLQQLNQKKSNLVLLLEVDPSWMGELQPLRQRLPYFKEIFREDNFGIAVYSDEPFEDLEIKSFDLSEAPAFSVILNKNQKPIHFVGIHPLPPISKIYFETRNSYYKNLASYLQSKNLPTILAGDFNSTPWSPIFQKHFGHLTTAFPGLTRPFTWQGGPMLITIDYILSSPELRAHGQFVGPDLGSDHRPVVADF